MKKLIRMENLRWVILDLRNFSFKINLNDFQEGVEKRKLPKKRKSTLKSVENKQTDKILVDAAIQVITEELGVSLSTFI